MFYKMNLNFHSIDFTYRIIKHYIQGVPKFLSNRLLWLTGTMGKMFGTPNVYKVLIAFEASYILFFMRLDNVYSITGS